MMRLLLFLTLLGGCTQYEAQIREGGDKAFSELETGSALATDAAFRYICSTARVGPLSNKINTAEKMRAWAVLCANNPQMPEMAQE